MCNSERESWAKKKNLNLQLYLLYKKEYLYVEGQCFYMEL